jgi:glutamyl/glutaminyl-tRNA synthetase
MTIDEIIDRFDFDGINQGNARFDEKKMAHINAEYIRQLPLETLAWMVSPILVREGLIDTSTDEDYIQDVLRVSQEKMTALNALSSLIGCFFTEDYPPDEKTQARIFKKGDPVARVREFLDEMDSMNDFSSESIDAYCEALAERNGFKKFEYFPVTRFAVSGTGGGPDLLPMLSVLGKDRVKARLEHFIIKAS